MKMAYRTSTLYSDTMKSPPQRNNTRHPCSSKCFPRVCTVYFFAVLLLLLSTNENGWVEGFGLSDVASLAASVPTHTEWMATAPAASSTGAHNLPSSLTLASSAAGLLKSVPVEPTDASSLGFDTTANAGLSTPEVWALRIGSGVLTYLGFVWSTDRPRGQLGVPLVDANNALEGCLEVRPSTVPGAGLGLFCTRSMPRGTVLGTYPGVVLPLGQHSASAKVRNFPSCASYVWRFTDNRFVIDPTDHSDGSLPEVCRGGNPSQLGSVAFFDLLSGLGLWRGVPTALCRINEPPKGGDVNVVTEEDLEARTVTFALERDVYAGEELHIDYGLTYDRSGYGNPSNL